MVIASYWSAHQRVFSAIVRADDLLVQLNMLLLFCIAFLPVPTNVLGTYGNQPASVILYAGTVVVTHSLVLALWIYATTHRRLVAHDFDSRLVRNFVWRLGLVALVFLASIAVAPFSPSLAEYSWLIIGVILFVARRPARRMVGAPHHSYHARELGLNGDEAVLGARHIWRLLATAALRSAVPGIGAAESFTTGCRLVGSGTLPMSVISH